MNFRTHIELSKQALEFNINQLKNIIGLADLAIVVKSNAYGCGIKEIALILENNNKVNWLCTANLSEAIELKKNNIKKSIIAFSYLDNCIETAIALDIHCPVYNLEDALLLNNIARSIGKIVNIHVKIDTGMSRLGILYNQAFEFIKKLQELNYIKLYGIFTHLSDTSNQDPSFSYLQLKRFDTLLDILEKNNIFLCTHVLSSSGIYLKPKKQYTLVRAGALAYGFWKSDKHKNLVTSVHKNFSLKTVMSWKTKIIQIKEIPANEFIGYDNTYKTKQKTKIAILPVGYYDGYSRSLSNNSAVLIKNQLAPVLGIISMNLTIVDITNITNININDEVILLGDYYGLTPKDIAQQAGTITNNIVARINSNIHKIII